jgi:hypothetical protein
MLSCDSRRLPFEGFGCSTFSASAVCESAVWSNRDSISRTYSGLRMASPSCWQAQSLFIFEWAKDCRTRPVPSS